MLVRRIRELERIPFGYGLAYWRLEDQRAVILPIPLNLCVGWSRRLWHVMAMGVGFSTVDSLVMTAYTKGFDAGRQRGRKERQDELDRDAMDYFKAQKPSGVV